VDSDDSFYQISMDIDSKWWSNHDNKLPIAFRVSTTRPVAEDSYGIDNFSIGVVCDRRLDDQIPEAEPSDEGDDGTYYCKAADYPCGDGTDMVHVCHYSTRLGYQTFCIPEADSEVLRFYNNDYCGPCVGGFGGVNNQ
jgi:hypothetical protein